MSTKPPSTLETPVISEEDKEKIAARRNGTGVAPFVPGIRFYELHFRAGNRKPMMKVFMFKGELPDAIKRSQAHCTKMDYRFCGCYPFVVDLDIQEKYREDNLNFDQY